MFVLTNSRHSPEASSPHSDSVPVWRLEIEPDPKQGGAFVLETLTTEDAEVTT